MLRFILAPVLSLLAVLRMGPAVLKKLKSLKQTENELGPKTHKAKQGTPVMGGVLFIVSSCVLGLLLHGSFSGFGDLTLAAVIVSFLTMLVGFVDDYIKVVKKRNLGLIWWQKVAGQVLISVAFSVFCALNPLVGTAVRIPFTALEWDLGIFYVPLMTLVMIFMVNSANLQDGVDGLLSSVTVIGSGAWALICLVGMFTASAALSAEMAGLAVFALALMGGCMGFLWFNYHPAKVFMGDTGSMFIGGAMVAFAMLLKQPFLMLLISFTPFCSSMSVITQRVYYKLTHGKRIFKMSPIHHHFELSGMTETQVVAMYSVVTAVLSLLAVLSVWPCA